MSDMAEDLVEQIGCTIQYHHNPPNPRDTFWIDIHGALIETLNPEMLRQIQVTHYRPFDEPLEGTFLVHRMVNGERPFMIDLCEFPLSTPHSSRG